VPAVAGVSSYSRSSTPLSFQTPFSKRSISPAPSSTREHSMVSTTRSQPNGNSLVCRIPLSLLNRHGIKYPLPTSISVTRDLRSSTLLADSSLIPSINDATNSLSSTAQWVADTMSAAPPPYDDTGLTKLHVGWTSDDTDDESSDDEEYDNVLEQVQAAAAAVHEAVTSKEAVDVSIT